MKRIISILLAGVSSGCMLLACQSQVDEGRFDPTAEGAGDPPEVGQVSEPVSIAAPSQASLPAVVEEGDCAERHGQTLDACDWVNSVDAVVYGTVADLRFVDAPLVGAGSSPGEVVEVSECDTVDPALVIALDVAEVLSGTAPKRVEVQIGARELSSWSPRPIPDRDGSVKWLETSGGKFTGTLSVGQRLGLALHSAGASGSWALLGEPLFEVDGHQAVHFQERVECTEPAPNGALSDLSGLRSTARSCAGKATAAANARQTRARAVNGPRSLGTKAATAAWCMQAPKDKAPGECDTGLDCPGGSVCQSGTCVAKRKPDVQRSAAPVRPR